MINSNRPVLNLDLDLLRTFVAVADLNTFAAAAAAVCRTQSAVSQQMQRLEQLVGRELFARHGRNKLLTDHGLQLLGYARQILRANDDATASLAYNDAEGELRIGASDDSVDSLLPFLLNRIASVYPRMAVDVRIKRSQYIEGMLDNHEIDLALTTARIAHHPRTALRTAPRFFTDSHVFSNITVRIHFDCFFLVTFVVAAVIAQCAVLVIFFQEFSNGEFLTVEIDVVVAVFQIHGDRFIGHFHDFHHGTHAGHLSNTLFTLFFGFFRAHTL